jgi:hypothetical protein
MAASLRICARDHRRASPELGAFARVGRGSLQSGNEVLQVRTGGERHDRGGHQVPTTQYSRIGRHYDVKG